MTIPKLSPDEAKDYRFRMRAASKAAWSTPSKMTVLELEQKRIEEHTTLVEHFQNGAVSPRPISTCFCDFCSNVRRSSYEDDRN